MSDSNSDTEQVPLTEISVDVPYIPASHSKRKYSKRNDEQLKDENNLRKSKSFEIALSRRKGNYLTVRQLDDSASYRRFNFGSEAQDTYFVSKDVVLRNKRIMKVYPKDYTNLGSMKTWSKYLLYNKPTLSESVKYMENRFGISITIHKDLEFL